jgi:hypothetical protein
MALGVHGNMPGKRGHGISAERVELDLGPCLFASTNRSPADTTALPESGVSDRRIDLWALA